MPLISFLSRIRFLILLSGVCALIAAGTYGWGASTVAEVPVNLTLGSTLGARTNCYPGECWENLMDGDYDDSNDADWNGTVSADKKGKSAEVEIILPGTETYALTKLRLLTDTKVWFKSRWVKDFEVRVALEDAVYGESQITGVKAQSGGFEEYAFPMGTKARSVKITFKTNYGDYDYFQIGEIELWGCKAEIVPVTDTTAPVITTVASAGETSNSVTVTWDTNEPADSQVEYGPTAGYGNITAVDGTKKKSHSVALTGLQPNTTYHCRIKSKDAAGNLSVSGDFNVKTLPTISGSLKVAYGMNDGNGSATTADVSGHDNTGNVVGASWEQEGKFGRALNFNGTNNYLSGTLDVALGRAFTMMGWVYNPTSSQRETVVSVGSNRSLYLSNGAIAFWNGTENLLGGKVPADQWVHLAVVYDGNQLTAYVNGKPEGPWVSVDLGPVTGKVQVGARVVDNGSPNADFFSGMIDEVKVYDMALGLDEIGIEMMTTLNTGTADVCGDIRIYMTADDYYTLYFNGEPIGTNNSNNDWKTAESYSVYALEGKNTIAIEGRNIVQVHDLNAAGILLQMEYDGGRIISDETWKHSALNTPGWTDVDFDDINWGPASIYAQYRAIVPDNLWCWSDNPDLCNVQGFPTPSDAKWIWSKNNDWTIVLGDSPVYFRYSFNCNQGQNSPPVVRNDVYQTSEDVPLTIPSKGVLENDSDADGDTLQAVMIEGAGNGYVALKSDGSFVYYPSANFHGQDSFRYQAVDALGAGSNAATVTMTVSPVNDAPVAANDTADVLENHSKEIDVLANDRDPDGDTLYVSAFGNPQHGHLSLSEDGKIIKYAPETNYAGLDSFTYKAKDKKTGGLESAWATVAVNVRKDDRCGEMDIYLTVDNRYDLFFNGLLIGQDYDNENGWRSAERYRVPVVKGKNVIALKGADDGSHIIAGVLLEARFSGGAKVLSGDRGWKYKYDPNFQESSGWDGTNADFPDADWSPVVNYGQYQNTWISPYNSWCNNRVECTIANFPTPSAAQWMWSAHNGESGTPTADTPVYFRHSFDCGDTYGLNHAPVAADDNMTVLAGTPSSMDVLKNDTDADGDALLIMAIVDQPSHGQATIKGARIEFTADVKYSGTDQLTYRAGDGKAGSDVAKVTITVKPLPDTTPPVVTVSTPLNNTVVVNTVTVKATATDNMGVAGVQFKLDGKNLGTEDRSVPYSLSWNTKTVNNGNHVLTAVARDITGNVQESLPVGVKVANVISTSESIATLSTITPAVAPDSGSSPSTTNITPSPSVSSGAPPGRNSRVRSIWGR